MWLLDLAFLRTATAVGTTGAGAFAQWLAGLDLLGTITQTGVPLSVQRQAPTLRPAEDARWRHFQAITVNTNTGRAMLTNVAVTVTLDDGF
jgi:hypothetical protein